MNEGLVQIDSPLNDLSAERSLAVYPCKQWNRLKTQAEGNECRLGGQLQAAGQQLCRLIASSAQYQKVLQQQQQLAAARMREAVVRMREAAARIREAATRCQLQVRLVPPDLSAQCTVAGAAANVPV